MLIIAVGTGLNFNGMGNNNTSREREDFIDLESGENDFPGDLSCDPNPVANEKQGNRFLNNLASGVLRYNISATSGSDSDSDSNLDKSSQDSLDSIRLLIDKNARRQQDEQIPLLEKELPRGKPQSTNSKMASKPPRPPRGPSLDSSDLMLVKEISEIVMKKRARKEHIKAFKRAKARAAKLSSAPSTSNNNTLCSLIVTVVFLLILIFHGT